jgi:hypothetical protein
LNPCLHLERVTRADFVTCGRGRKRSADLWIPFLVNSGRYPSFFDVVRDRYGIKRRRSATTTLAFSTLQAVRGMSLVDPSDMVHLDPALGKKLLDVRVGEAEAQVPADRQGDDLGREPVPGEG